MRYLSELLAYNKIKQPVQAYIYTDASEERATLARDLCTSVAVEMQKSTGFRFLNTAHVPAQSK